MKTPVWFLILFLVSGAVSEDLKSNQPNPVLDTKTLIDEPHKPVVNVGSTVGKAENKSSVETGKTTLNPVIKVSTPKTVSSVDVPNSHSDVVDITGDTMFSRAAYLLTGISVFVLLYFAWKSFSVRRRPTHIHKYGVVASREDLEMTSLGFGSEDEEDDTTHFDIGKHQRS